MTERISSYGRVAFHGDDLTLNLMNGRIEGDENKNEIQNNVQDNMSLDAAPVNAPKDKEFGDYKTNLMSFEYQGEEGQKKIQKIMEVMREPNINEVIPNIESIGDYKTGLITGKDGTRPTGLPKSDVIKFFLKNGETIVIRPSGTEPKLKAYVFALGQESLDRLVNIVKNFISKI